MATTILNDLILQASRRAQEYRTSAAATDDTNRRWKSSNWTDYFNNAVRDLLRSKLEALNYDIDKFAALFPEYVKESLVFVGSGVTAKPDGALTVLEMRTATVTYFKVPPEMVATVKTGRDKVIVPSADNPVFWEEGTNIYTLGILSGGAYVRYIYMPANLAVITSADGNGKKNSGNGSYTAATNLLTIAMAGNFVAGTDENRRVMFYDNAAGKVFYGKINNIPSTGSAVLEGDGLPAANIGAGDVTIALMEELSDEDIKLNRVWFGELIERAVKYALADSITKPG